MQAISSFGRKEERAYNVAMTYKKMRRPKIGAHIRTAGGVSRAIENAFAIGALNVFLPEPPINRSAFFVSSAVILSSDEKDLS